MREIAHKEGGGVVGKRGMEGRKGMEAEGKQDLLTHSGNGASFFWAIVDKIRPDFTENLRHG